MISDFESSKHPVHFVKKYGKKSPSAFIPFCEFGGNMSAMGVKINQFDVPICTSFLAKIRNDQLCYEVNLNNFTNQNNLEKELELGFVFIMDYNEDRQITLEQAKYSYNGFSLADRIDKSHDDDHAVIYLNTIGKSMYFNKRFIK